MMFKIVDGYNGDVICNTQQIDCAAHMLCKYHEECEGDFDPIMYVDGEAVSDWHYSYEGKYIYLNGRHFAPDKVVSKSRL